MLDLFLGLKRVIKRRIVHIDNSVFRLHWLFTSIMLISCSLIVTSRQYVGDPIDCLQTDDIPPKVLNTYCWIHSTYTIPSAFDKLVGVEVAHPGIERSKGRVYEDALESELNQHSTTVSSSDHTTASSATTKKHQLVRNNRNLFRSTKYRKYYTYYQWVCFALFIQAILFYLPYFIWKLWEGGLLQAITIGMQLTMISNEERDRKRKILNDYLYSHLRCHRGYAYKYFICEFLCFANVTAQFYLTDWFFDGEFFQYGIKVLRYAKHDPSFSYDPSIFIFPRMTKCTFHSYGFSGDVQRHDALCMLTLNVVNEKIYIFIWFWLALLWMLLIFVLAYRIVILFAWNWRGYFLTKRCTLSHYEDLDYICKNGNIGDWFLLYMLGSNLDPLLMREVTDEMATRMREDQDKEYQAKQEIIKQKLISNGFDLTDFIGLTNRPVQSSAPPSHHLQFSNSQYLNSDLKFGYCLSQTNCPKTPTKPNRLQENISLTKKMQKCNECSYQLSARSVACNQQNRDDELASLIDNQTTIAANHCLKDNCKTMCRDDCTDRQSVRSAKSSKSINKNDKIKKLLALPNRLKCVKTTTTNLNNASDQTNATSSGVCCESVSKSSCPNGCCFNSSETNSLGNSSSGVCLDFESKLNEDGNSNSEDEQTIRRPNCSQHCSQAFSQNQTSGYQSNLFSNRSNGSHVSTNNSDTLDQVSSLEPTSEKASSSPEQPSTKQASKRALSLEKAIRGLVSYKNRRRKSSTSSVISAKSCTNYKTNNSMNFPMFTDNSSTLNNSNNLFDSKDSKNRLKINDSPQSHQTDNLEQILNNRPKKHSCSVRSNSFTPAFSNNKHHTIEINDQIADDELFNNFLGKNHQLNDSSLFCEARTDQLSSLSPFVDERQSKINSKQPQNRLSVPPH